MASWTKPIKNAFRNGVHYVANTRPILATREFLDRDTNQRDLHVSSMQKLATELDVANKDIGFGKTRFDTHILERYAEQRAKDPSIFNETVFNDTTFGKLAQSNPQFTEVQLDLKQIFNSSDAFENSRQRFLTEAKALATNAQGSQKVVNSLIGIADAGRTAIKVQQKNEMKSLEQYFSANPEKLAGVKADNLLESLRSTLAQQHQKQLDQYHSAVTHSMNSLHNAARLEIQRYLFEASLYKNSKNMRKQFEELAALPRSKNASTTLTMQEQDGKVHYLLSSVDFNSLKYLKRDSGERIEKSEDGVYTLNMGYKIFNPRYYLLNRDRTDLVLLANAIKLSGCEAITMNLQYANPEVAKKRAQDAFRACIEAGFDPSKITLRVNNDLMTYKGLEKATEKEEKSKCIRTELFSESEYSALENHAKEVQQQRDKMLDNLLKPYNGLKEFKSEYNHDKQANVKAQFNIESEKSSASPNSGAS